MTSHYKMAPMQRMEELRDLSAKPVSPKKAAVLSLFYPDVQGETHLVLIKRNTYPGVHSAQIGFPGGRVEDQDNSLMHTALRETEEEIGVGTRQVTIIKELSEIFIPPSNFLVRPFMGTLVRTPRFIPDDNEVARILEIPLLDFLDDSALTTRKIDTSYAKSIDVPAFLLRGQIVWGATAMVLSEVKDLLKRVL